MLTFLGWLLCFSQRSDVIRTTPNAIQKIKIHPALTSARVVTETLTTDIKIHGEFTNKVYLAVVDPCFCTSLVNPSCETRFFLQTLTSHQPLCGNHSGNHLFGGN